MYSDLEGLYARLLDRKFQVALFGDLKEFQSTADGYTACCPFHAESLPTLLIHGARPGYFCFVCGARGDWIDYQLRRKPAMSYQDALHRLETEAAVRIGTEEATWREELLYSELLQAVQDISIAELWSENGLVARSYLTDRGYTQEEIEGMELGLAPTAQSLQENLASGFPPPLLETLSKRMLAAYAGTPLLSIPYRDSAGRLMGFYGRSITDEGSVAYRPLTDMTRLKDVPFLMHRARGSAQIVVVQGFLDALLADQIGIQGVIGVGRSGLTPDFLATAVSYGAGRFLLSLDSLEATAQAIERIRALGLEARVVKRPEKYSDTDAYIRDSCINKFGILLEKTVSAEEWLSRHPGSVS
ncbi:MAG: CHC2 zinc finger domain-containing protein [Syntrophaceae bacterium]